MIATTRAMIVPVSLMVNDSLSPMFVICFSRYLLCDRQSSEVTCPGLSFSSSLVNISVFLGHVGYYVVYQ